MSNHERFILTSITTEIKGAVSAISPLGSGIETFPLNEYVMHSLFLKMTGFQEQKMKCIAWEMADADLEYRRCYLDSAKGFGEYSTYESKNKIFSSLIEIIKKHIPSYEADTALKDDIKKKTLDDMEILFDNSNLSVWDQRKYTYFKDNKETIFISENFMVIGNKNNFLIDNLLSIYKNELYPQRNRAAHNLTSYQENLPSLLKLYNENDLSRNYFIFFALLTLIDNIFITLFKKFKEAIEENDY